MDSQMDAQTRMGDIQIKDHLSFESLKAVKIFRRRFSKYKQLVDEIGEEAAFEQLMVNYPERQKELMGMFIEHDTIANGFQKVRPIFHLMGFETEFVDVSENGSDAALEIQRVCPVLPLAREYGFATPCRVVCEMSQEAARRAYPEMKASILSKISEGDCVCVFKYERPAQTVVESTSRTPNIFIQIIQLLQLAPALLQIGVKILKTRLENRLMS